MLEILTATSVNPVEIARDADTILLPKNSNERLAVDWLRANDFDVPDFPGKQVEETSEGQRYKLVRDPEAVSDVEEAEPGAIVSFLGEDKIEEWEPSLGTIWIGEMKGCDMVLAAKVGKLALVQAKIVRGEIVTAASTYKNSASKLGAACGVIIEPTYKSGSVEAYADDFDAIVDLRVTGQSLADNKIFELMVLRKNNRFGMNYKEQEAA